MAKAKQTVKESAPLELENTLVVDGKTYNINAVAADIARQLLGVLSINGETFDGTENKAFDVMPKTGGDFSGSITVPTSLDQETPEESQDKTVLNRTDISHIVKQLTGSTWYKWNTDSQELSPSITDNNEYARLGIILEDGLGNYKVEEFAQYNYLNKEFPLWLYISKANEIYWGVSSNVNPFKLSTAYTLERRSTDNSKIPSYTAKTIYEKFNDISSLIEKISKGEQYVGIADKLRTDDGENITGDAIIARIDDLKLMLSEFIGNITSGATYAGRAYNADNAGKLNGQGSEYYQKKIFVSTTEPTGAVNGDIWIKYS